MSDLFGNHIVGFPTRRLICYSGTHGVHDLVFELTGIDLETTTKDDLQKDMLDVAVSPVDFAPKVQDRAISVIRFTPEEPPPGPTPSPEIQEHISPERITPEHISPDLKQVCWHRKFMCHILRKYSFGVSIKINRNLFV